MEWFLVFWAGCCVVLGIILLGNLKSKQKQQPRGWQIAIGLLIAWLFVPLVVVSAVIMAVRKH